MVDSRLGLKTDTTLLFHYDFLVHHIFCVIGIG